MKFLRSEWVLIPCVFLLALLLCAAIIPVRTSADYSTVVYAADSSMLHVFLNKEDKWRLQVKAGEVSLLLKKILLFKEDKYFRFHPGVNPLAVVRAAWNNFIKGRRTSGASTLTMQVVGCFILQSVRLPIKCWKCSVHFNSN